MGNPFDPSLPDEKKRTLRWIWKPVGVVILSGILWLAVATFFTSRAAPDQAAQDLSISKSHQGDFQIDSTGVYSITVTNAGTDVVSGTITVTDVLAESLAPISANGSGWDPCGFTGQTMTCVYSNTAGLGTGLSLPLLRLSVDVGVTTDSVITNTVSVSNTNDALPDNNIAIDPTDIVGADLAATKSVAPASPLEGSIITYTLTTTNNGPSPATGVVMTDTLPSGITYQTSTASQGTYTNANGIWSIGSLAQGATATLRITAHVNAGTQGTTITNTTEGLRSDIYDYDQSNNTATTSFTVASVVSTQIRGRVTSNATDQPLSGALVQLLDSADESYNYTTGANGWYTFTQTITTPIATGSGTINVSRTGYVSKSATVLIVAGQSRVQDFALDNADLLITKSDGRTTIFPGSTITYTITVSNVGTVAASTVVITDVLPSQMTYITDTLDITHSVPVAHTYRWELDNSIAPNAAVRFRLRVRVANALPSPTTALTNVVRATTRTAESVTSNNASQDTNTSTGTPTPAITISVSPNQVRTNQNATYTIKVSNTGTAPMTNLSIVDTFSSFLDISSARTTQGTATVNNSTRRVTVTTDVLAADDDFTITVVGRDNSSATTNSTVTNSATLTYTFGGSNFSRTSNTVSFQIIATSTLPGTGGVELAPAEARVRADVPAFLAAFVLGILGLAALTYGLWARSRQPDWSGWSLKMGLTLLAASVLFGITAWGLRIYINRLDSDQVALLRDEYFDIPKDRPAPVHTPETIIWPGAPLQIPGSELDKLPDFPIPTPTITSTTAQEGESGPDISPVNRLIIPALALDAEVKYVPYDGLTWLIAGLRQEIAWLGDTSWPGIGGNTALAGHVTLSGGGNGPFRYLSELRYGDSIFVQTAENVYQYMVQDSTVVEQTDIAVLEPTDESRLTLITCTEWDPETGFYMKRLVVEADLIQVRPVQIASQSN